MNRNQEQLLETIYKETFPDAARLVRKLGGDLPTAQDIFHDAIIIYMEKIQSGRLNINQSPGSYIIGITKILWLKKFNRDIQITTLNEANDALAIPEDFYAPADRNSKRLSAYLKMAGKKCMQLLQAFYYDDWSLQKIKEEFNYTTRHSASVQKHKCLEKVREQIKTSSAYEEFIV